MLIQIIELNFGIPITVTHLTPTVLQNCTHLPFFLLLLEQLKRTVFNLIFIPKCDECFEIETIQI